MPATTILSNNPVNSVFSNDNSHFTYRHIDFSIELLLSSGTVDLPLYFQTPVIT